jgi:hypothetical protein
MDEEIENIRKEWLKKKQELEEKMTQITRTIETGQKLTFTEYLGRKMPEYIGTLTIKEKKDLKEEYERLWKQYTILLLNEVSITLDFKPVIFYECRGKQLGLVYDNGQWYLLSLVDPIYLGKHPPDSRLVVENNMPREFRERTFIARIGQGELIYPIHIDEKANLLEDLEPKPKPKTLEEIRTERRELAKDIPAKVEKDDTWLCLRCNHGVPIRVEICPNCGLSKQSNTKLQDKLLEEESDPSSKMKRLKDFFNKD